MAYVVASMRTVRVDKAGSHQLATCSLEEYVAYLKRQSKLFTEKLTMETWIGDKVLINYQSQFSTYILAIWEDTESSLALEIMARSI